MLATPRGNGLQVWLSIAGTMVSLSRANQNRPRRLLWFRSQQEGDWLCIGYRPLNKVTPVPTCPLPLMQQASDSLQGKGFSVSDSHNAYWQVRVKKESRRFPAFVAPDGLWKWNQMPFGAAVRRRHNSA